MNLPEFGVRRPITNLMIFCAIIILALYTTTRIGIDSMPKIEPPIISIISAYPGASPEDVEQKVTEPLENQLATTPGIEKITSTSSEGISLISIKFKWGVSMDAASNDVRDRIDLAKRFLPDIPDEMDNPFIYKFNTANIPILFLGITAESSYAGLYDLIDTRVGDALRQMAGVGAVELIGGLERQINVHLNRQRLEGYGLSVLDIQNTLAAENISQPVGKLKTGLSDYLVRLPGEFSSPEEINTVILGKRDGKFVYLKDVATIEDSFKETTLNVRINKKPGLLLMIQKQTDSNTVEVAKAVKAKLDALQKTLPADVKLFLIFDSSQDITDSLNTLRQAVWLGIILVMAVVWFFLRRLLPSLIIALTIPFSLMISFIYLFLSGKTVNSISLSSLAIATGMVVDNAIVVVDNIYRRLERGNRPAEAAIFGTQEMFLSIAASTATTVVVFLPMLFVPGVIGVIFGELAVIVTATLIGSLFTAATFTPMLSSCWMKTAAAPGARHPLFRRFYNASERAFFALESSYARALGWCLEHKKMVLGGFGVAFVATMALVPLVGNEFYPDEDTGDVRLTIHLPLGTRLEESDKVARRIEDIFQEAIPEARFFFARTGEVPGRSQASGQQSGTNIVISGVKLVPKTERSRSDKVIAQALRSKVKQIPGVMKVDISVGNPIGRMITGAGGKAIRVEVIGNSFPDTDAVGEQIIGAMQRIPGAVDASLSRELNRPELRIQIDREKASNLGLSMYTIASSLKTYIQGSTATKYREKGNTYDIYVRLEEASREKIEDLENLVIISPLSQVPVRLGTIARIHEEAGPLSIERQNRARVLYVECNTFQRSTGKVVEDLKKEMRKLVLPQDVIINFGGEAEEQKKAFADLGLLLLLGIALVYMIMAAQFESLADPFIIMFAIPFTFIGVILSFVLARTTLSVVSYLGVIMLMGIVVNNAIVLVSYIGLLRARGNSMYAAVTQSGKDRLRPIMMTTITTIAGLVPMAISTGVGSESWQPLGITMIGGLTVSTLITLLFVPTMYAVFHRKSAAPRQARGEAPV